MRSQPDAWDSFIQKYKRKEEEIAERQWQGKIKNNLKNIYS